MGHRPTSGRVLPALLDQHKCIRYLRLTTDETALMAGLDAAIGDYVVTLHPDFDPPAELVSMVETCRGGSDLVLGVDRNPPPLGLTYRILRQVFLANLTAIGYQGWISIEMRSSEPFDLESLAESVSFVRDQYRPDF